MARISLTERLLTDPELFGLTTATPVQRAICRVADGVPLGGLALHPDVATAFGTVEGLPERAPTELYILAGIRSAKSLFGAALATKDALTADLSGLRPGEVPRVSVLSLDKDKARVLYGQHLVGTFLARPALRSLIVGDPTSDTLTIRRPDDGRLVEIMVVAGARSGGALVARWSAGCIFDEAARMVGQEDGVVNFDDARTALLGRLLPGAQLAALSSPWAPRGPMFDAVQEYWGKPSPHLVVVRAPGPVMNPYWWTKKRIEELRLAPGGELSYRTDVLGEFADPESAFISTDDLKAVTRKDPPARPPEDDLQYFAAMDPATRRNAWTLVIVGRRHKPDGTFELVVSKARQWLPQPGAPLDPGVVLADVADELRVYGMHQVVTDQWATDALRVIARDLKLELIEQALTGPDKVRLFDALKMRILGKTIELPPDTQVRDDLLSVRKKVTATSIAIVLPVTTDGRHADYAPALAIAAEAAANSPSWAFAMRRMLTEGGGLFGQAQVGAR